MIPIENQQYLLQLEKAQETAIKNEQDLFNEIEGRRHDVVLPAITEEKAGATGTNSTEQHFRVAENYPLKQLKLYPEVLLVNLEEMRATIEEKLGFKCEQAATQAETMARVSQASKDFKQKNREFFNYVMVNGDDTSLNLAQLHEKVIREMTSNKIHTEIKFYVFAINQDQSFKEEIIKTGFDFFVKPSTSQVLDVLRHMVPLGDSEVVVAETKVRRS